MAQHINLNDDWKYSKFFEENMVKASYHDVDMETVRLPHTNIQTPFHYFDEKIYQFVSCYRKHILAEEVWRGKQVLLTFEGVAHVAKVYINGNLAVTHLGGYTAFTFDLAEYLQYGIDNVIAVEVDSRETNNIPPFGNVIDYLTYGGIYREVYVDVKEPISIEDAFIITKDVSEKNSDDLLKDCEETILKENKETVQKGSKEAIQKESKEAVHKKSKEVIQKESKEVVQQDYTEVVQNGSKEVEIKVSFHGYHPKLELILIYNIRDISNTNIHTGSAVITEQTAILKFHVERVKNWDISDPNLYYLDLELRGEKNKRLDEKTIRFGFRTCEFKKDGFYLNNRKIKLLGLNRHQSYPYVGYAMPKRMQRRDAEILKEELQVNAVRTSHYPQSKHFIDRCDELGFLVFTEIPGWQHIGDEQWKETACENVREMVLQYRNHPSIILWGVRINESLDDNEFYRKTNQIAHQLDSSRQTTGVRYLMKSSLLEDVYAYNDFLHNGTTKGLDKKEVVTSDKNAPYLVSEFNGHMFPTKSFDDEEHRLNHALRHARILDAVFEQEEVGGGFGWCMFDYNTHKDFGSGDRICYHGVMDMFRNEKLAASVYSSQSDRGDICEITSSLDIGEHPAGNIGEIYAFTNADCIRLYKNDIFIKEFYPNRTKYANMPHPPIQIDDFVGDLLERQEHYSPKTAKVLKEVLYAVQKYGQNNLPLKYKLKMAMIMIRNHLTMDDGVRLYYKYIGSWGGAATTFRFEAVKDGKVVKTVEKKPVAKVRLLAVTKETELKEEETYDVAEIRISAVDEYHNRLPYYQEPITLEAWGAVELIGPNIISLKGGAAGAYVRTKGASGEGGLKIIQADLGQTEVKFRVIV